MNDADNTFTGAVALNTSGSSGNATIKNDRALLLAASSVGGALSATATANNITQNGILTITGTSSFTTSASGADIVLNSENLFGGAVALNTTGSSAYATVVDASGLDLAASTVNGNLTATATTGNIEDSGVLTVTGNSSFTTSANNATITLNNANAFTGSVALSTTGSSAHATVVDASGLKLGTSTVGGNLVATATEGDISDSGILTITGAATFITTEATQDIILDLNNVFTTTVTMQAGDGSAAFNDITFVDSGAVNLHSEATSNGDLFIDASTDLDVDGDLVIKANAGNITQGSEVAVGATSTFTTSASNGTITLNDADNAFTGAVALNTNGSSSNAIIKNDRALLLAASSVGGALTATATAGDITQNGALTITGAATFITTTNNRSIVLDQSGNAFTSTVTMKAGDGSNATFNNITFVDSAAVKLHSAAATAGDLFINASTDLAVGGNLSITATTGDITQGAAIAITGAATFITTANNRSIILDQNNVFTTTVTMQAGNGSSAFNDITFVDSAAVNLNSSAASNGDLFINAGTDLAVSGDLSITATTGNITQGSELAVVLTSTFTTSASNGTITLNDADNTFTGAVALNTSGSSGNATIKNDRALLLAASSVGGALSATATAGNITQSGALAITGTSTLVTSANHGTMTLTNTGNAFTGKLLITTNDVSPGTLGTVNIDGGTTNLIIGLSTIDGNLTLLSGGTITDDGIATVRGTLTATTDAGDSAIILNQLAVTGALTLDPDDTGAVTIVNAVNLDLAASTMGGTFSGTATTGDISDSGDLAITGAATFITAQAAQDIILDQNNAFTTTVTMKAGTGGSLAFNDITFKDSDGVRLHSSAASNGDLFIDAGTNLAVGGDLSITATTGNITQGSELAVTNTSTFTTSASGGTITLNDADNTFTGAVALNTNGSSSNATVKNKIALLLAASSVGGALSATATTGNITQNGALTITGTSTLVTSADHGTIDLKVNSIVQCIHRETVDYHQ